MKNHPSQSGQSDQSSQANQSGQSNQSGNTNQSGSTNQGNPDHGANVNETEQIFYNGNIAAVQSGPTRPTHFTLDRDRYITKFTNYHYFNNGTAPGTIWIVHTDGTMYGPWKTTGSMGQWNVKDAYWNCHPNIWIKAGTYTVFDSHPATWSHNIQSKNEGFTWIEAMK